MLQKKVFKVYMGEFMKNKITIVAFIFSMLLNLNAYILVNKLNEMSSVWNTIYVLSIIASVVALSKLVVIIKEKNIKNKSNRELVKRLATYLALFMGAVLIVGCIFGILAVILSITPLEEENIKNITNIITTLITIFLAPVVIWTLINVVRKSGKTITIIKKSIVNMKEVYIRLLVLSVLYILIGNLLKSININGITILVNTFIQTLLLIYIIKLQEAKGGK
jgi:hypothetical protein